MFYYIEGTVSILEPMLAVVDCNGVGYALNITANTAGRLKTGEKARLYTYCLIREDCFDLYGFYSLDEKRCFELLIGVSGVGPKAAQAILSASTPESLSLAVISGNERALTVAQGIGKKIAQRVILELKDKMAKEQKGMEMGGFTAVAVPEAGGKTGKLNDAAAALGVLGYGNNEIAAALKGVDVDNLSVEDIVRQALRKMMK